MSVLDKLVERSANCCELCASNKGLTAYTVEPGNSTKVDENVLVCSTCESQINGSNEMDPNHWRCLNESMWSEIPAVQVLSWRMLNRLKSNGWASDLLDMLYLDDVTLAWAKATGEDREKEEAIKHVDSNGVVLENGDTVVLIKDLDVKGANFTAKRGTAVRNIKLVHDNAEQIEGKVNGQGIVILTQYVKK
jgi:protein PhnA